MSTSTSPVTRADHSRKRTRTAMRFVMAGLLGFGASHVMQAEPPPESPVQAKDSAPKPVQPSADEKLQPRLDRYGDPLPPGAIRRFGTLRFRHWRIEDVAFTPDGKRVIAGMGDDPLSVFDARTGRKLREVGKSNSGRSITEFAVSPDGKWVASCGRDVVLWEIETGRLVRELHCGDSHAVAFSADGKVLAAAGWAGRGNTAITLVELATGKHLGKWTFKEGELGPADLHPLAFSPDGKYLAGLFCKQREVKPTFFEKASSQVWLLDAQNGSRVRTFGSASGLIGAFAFQPGTGRLATLEKKGVLRFWDMETGKEVHPFSIALGKWDNKDRPPPGVLRFSADGRRCAVADGIAGLLVVLDAQTGREVRRIEIDKASGWIAADLSHDGRAITAARTLGLSCVRVWDLDSGVERLGDAGHRTPATIALSADEGTLIGRSEDGQVIHWDRRSSQAVQRRQKAPEQAGRPEWTPRTGDWTLRGPRWRLRYHFATSMLSVHSLDDDRLLGEAEWPALARDLALSPDGVYVATTLLPRRWNTVLLWNPEKEKQPRRLTGNVEFFRRLLFSHDGKRLIATARTHNAHPSSVLWVWDVATSRPIHKLPTNSFRGDWLLTADDRVLIYGGDLKDDPVHVWDMETGRELVQFTDSPSKNRGSIGGLALSADERFLAVIFSWDDHPTVSVWETSSWKPVRMFPPMQRAISSGSIIFSRDGRSLFVSNSDTTILEWDVSGRFGRKTEVPNTDRLNVLWRTLIESPNKAYPAVWEMLDHPAASVPFLIDKVSPVKPVEEKRVRQLLAQLDSESFAEREEAGHKLVALGEQIVPMLRQVLKERLTLEVRKRVEGIIESLNRGPTSEQLRLLRAVAVLEGSSRPEAAEHLRRLAGGAPSASLTRAAKAAWQRRKR